MSKALEQKLADALEAHERLSALEKEFRSNGFFIKKGDHPPYAGLIQHSVMLDVGSTLLTDLGGEEYETTLKQDGLLIELAIHGNRPNSVNAVDLVERVKRLIGEDSPLSVKIRTYGPTAKYWDVDLFVTIDTLRDKQINEVRAVFLSAQENISTEIGYNSNDPESKGPALTVYTKGQYDPRLINLLRAKSKGISQSSIGSITFELHKPLQSVADFLALIKESAEVLQTERYMVTSLDVQTPVRDLNVLQKPPIFELRYEDDGIKLYYEASKTEQLRLLIPKTQLAKAAEFYDGLKVESRR